jgi:hypothetical protein
MRFVTSSRSRWPAGTRRAVSDMSTSISVVTMGTVAVVHASSSGSSPSTTS